MPYIALARKWRPRSFHQLIGQEHVSKALTNALNKQRLHHAYLFTGTRGVGKSSVARLFAKALNCEQGISAEPCLQCDACLSIEQGRFIDLIEIDGASKTRVEDTRELLENVQYVPSNARFKIYIIDEVHMLSQHSFNALLKTLEEPPPHVKFLLATTDLQKLPVTILSRCLQFHLKHLTIDVICQQLALIMADEKLSYDQEALRLLAKAASGSMRDALSLLDQVIASVDTHLYTEEVQSCLGYTKEDYALQLLEALAQSAPEQLMMISRQIATESGHFHYVVQEMLCDLHQISLSQNLSNTNPLIAPPPEIVALSTQFSPEDVQLFYQIGIKGLEELDLAPNLAIGFDMMLLRMYTFRPLTDEGTIPPLHHQTKKVLLSETRTTLDSHSTPVAVESPIVPITEELILDEPKEESVSSPDAREPVTKTEETDWNAIINQLNLSGLALNAALQAELVSRTGAEVILRVDKRHVSVFTTTVKTRIEQGLSNYYGERIMLTLNTDEEVLSSPAQLRQESMKKKQDNAEAALQNDPCFKELQQTFSAEVVKGSIVPLEEDTLS